MLRLNQRTEDDDPLLFEITSAHICEKDGPEKKYVIYTLQVRHISGREDGSPAIIERRYTHFYNLHNALKKEHPELMVNIVFPRKVLMGNFDNTLITERSASFETFLKHISTDPKLCGTRGLLSFLQDEELTKIKQFIKNNEYSYALSILENSFRLLNNVYTDRSPAVLFALCRLLGCSVSIPGSPNAQKWADLLLHRYEGVSDSDLLELYLPLLQVCIKVWWQVGRDKENLEQQVLDLRRQGLKSDDSLSLLDAVDVVEKRISELN